MSAAARRGTTDQEEALTERPYQEIVDHAVTRGEAALRGWASAPHSDHTPTRIANGDYTPPQDISDAVTDLLHLAARHDVTPEEIIRRSLRNFIAEASDADEEAAVTSAVDRLITEAQAVSTLDADLRALFKPPTENDAPPGEQ